MYEDGDDDEDDDETDDEDVDDTTEDSSLAFSSSSFLFAAWAKISFGAFLRYSLISSVSGPNPIEVKKFIA